LDKAQLFSTTGERQFYCYFMKEETKAESWGCFASWGLKRD